MIVDLFLVYQFIKRLATPFDEWQAYDLGIIDERGEILIKRKDMTIEQRSNWGKFDVLVLKLKRLLEKIPGGRSRLASYAAALWLIKEDENRDADMLTEELIEDELNQLINQIEEHYKVEEDAPANAAGGGNIAGVGVGPDGEPGFTSSAMNKYKKRNKKKVKNFVDMITKIK